MKLSAGDLSFPELLYNFKNLSNLGDSEEMLGRFLPDYDRESFVIATKVGRYNKKAKDMFDFSYAKTISSGTLANIVKM